MHVKNELHPINIVQNTEKEMKKAKTIEEKNCKFKFNVFPVCTSYAIF